MKRNIWLDGMMGVIVGDALGCPVQFMAREKIAGRAAGPVKGMESGGVYHMPEGTWTDDSSLALATLDSIRKLGEVDPEDIMTSFVGWYEKGEYTPFGEAFDIGNTCSLAIEKFKREKDTMTCGGTSERSNGNGSLMRIMPACLYAYDRKLSTEAAVKTVHEVGGLTHNHLRAKIACGLYYFCVKAILDGQGSLKERLQKGLDEGFAYYEKDIAVRVELACYGRLRDLAEFASVPEVEIKSTGYVVDSLEAAVWSLVRTDSFRDCLLTAVNLGDDSDTVGAIAGGLAALYYGYDGIPGEWLAVIKRREWIEDLCKMERSEVRDE
jgi:ADP-ribosylglycohydrolase